MFTLAQISDVHLAPLPPVPMRALFGKRLTGFVSWKLNRSHLHRLEMLGALLDDVRQQRFDHLCVSGDLVNLALPAEISRAALWLRDLASRAQVSVVPGNHDAYTAHGARLALAEWAPWIGGEFPTLRRFGAVAIIGLNTGVPTPPFNASGRLGMRQIERLEAMLASLGAEGATRIVVLHHPPQEGAAPRRKALVDALEFRSVIARTGAELILHGHLHRPVRGSIAGPGGAVPVFGAGSASLRDPARSIAAQYYLVDVADGHVAVRSRAFDLARAAFVETVVLA